MPIGLLSVVLSQQKSATALGSCQVTLSEHTADQSNLKTANSNGDQNQLLTFMCSITLSSVFSDISWSAGAA
jgi:hypothetical protein